MKTTATGTSGFYKQIKPIKYEKLDLSDAPMPQNCPSVSADSNQPAGCVCLAAANMKTHPKAQQAEHINTVSLLCLSPQLCSDRAPTTA